MPVGKFERPENAMCTPIYNGGGGGGGDLNSSCGGGRGGGRGHRYDNAFTERQERSNMQRCHQLQRHFVVLTDDTMAHEMERKLQAGEEEGFRDDLRTAVHNNINQWAQSDHGLGEWVKENEMFKILEVVLLRPPQDLWAESIGVRGPEIKRGNFFYIPGLPT